MNLKSCLSAVVAITLAVSSSVGAAAQSSPAENPKVRPAANPNQKICEDITQVGSRLATKRICATRAEWEAQKRADKETVDGIQRSPNTGCAQVGTLSSTPSC